MTLANLMKIIKEKSAKANLAKKAKSSAWDIQSLAELAVESGKEEQKAPQKQNQLVQVRCIDCLHFTPDKIGNGSGIGNCSIGITWTQQVHGRMPLYPNVLSYCSHFDDRII